MNKIEKEFISLFRQNASFVGVHEDISSIVAFLYLQPSPVTMETIAKELGYSVSSICTKLKFIEQLGMIKKTRNPGSKKIYFFIDDSFPSSTFLKIVASKIQLTERLLLEIPKLGQSKKQNLDSKATYQLKKIEKYYKEIKFVNKALKEIMDSMKRKLSMA